MTAIKIDTETKFAYTDNEGDYGIAFVLIEDGMSGSGSQWAQSNYLSGDANYATSNPFWYNAPSMVSNVTFNHVAVAAWDILNGVDGSVSPTIVVGILDYNATGVNTVQKSSVQDSGRYLLDGRKVSSPHSGLNIIKMSDGTIRKEFVK